ncbi:DUF1398 family protein [Aquabacter sp. CN5-332]|uniref:DUF1398 domain-containing protein n=1 Tax=Aquabacter sp. CN5-332 TaxID=3156608 RepID=UPI0032B61236
MEPHVTAAMEAATRDSDAERVTFPEVVAQLMEAGIERYHADLQRNEKTYYLPSGASHVVAAHEVGAVPAEGFSAEGVERAVRAVQAGQIKYREFCARIAAAGCVAYLVSLAGRRAVYYGRTGETHVEWFPGAKPN